MVRAVSVRWILLGWSDVFIIPMFKPLFVYTLVNLGYYRRVFEERKAFSLQYMNGTQVIGEEMYSFSRLVTVKGFIR